MQDQKQQEGRPYRPPLETFVRNRLKRGEMYGLGFTLAILVVFAALWIFSEIAEGVADESAIYQLDFHVQDMLADVITPDVTWWVIQITRIGGYPIITLLIAGVAAFFFLRRLYWRFFQFLIATAGGFFVFSGLKLLFQRARPESEIVRASGYSFPSGHAFESFVFFGFLIYVAWADRWPLFWRWLLTLVGSVLILLIGASRVYLDVHWVTDVLAGYTMALAWLVSVIMVVRIVEHRRKIVRVRATHIP